MTALPFKVAPCCLNISLLNVSAAPPHALVLAAVLVAVFILIKVAKLLFDVVSITSLITFSLDLVKLKSARCTFFCTWPKTKPIPVKDHIRELSSSSPKVVPNAHPIPAPNRGLVLSYIIFCIKLFVSSSLLAACIIGSTITSATISAFLFKTLND